MTLWKVMTPWKERAPMAAYSGSNEGRYFWKFTVANLVYLPKVEIFSKLPPNSNIRSAMFVCLFNWKRSNVI